MLSGNNAKPFSGIARMGPSLGQILTNSTYCDGSGMAFALEHNGFLFSRIVKIPRPKRLSCKVES